MLDFSTAVSLFKNDKIRELSATDEGMRFLKLRSLSRKEHLDYLINKFEFEWGGLHQNSLEATIVNRYVKKITSYDSLSEAIEGDLHNSLRAYVLASWYNHWTSIIIEDIFKEHVSVIPAVGQIKKIDFFVNNKPFDLKVTYLPEGYIKDHRKASGLRPELTLMKNLARELKIGFDTSVSESALFLIYGVNLMTIPVIRHVN